MSASLYPPGIPIEQVIAESAQAGFDGIGLCLGAEGRLTFESTEASCLEIRRRVQDAGLEITGLALENEHAVNYASPDPALRKVASERTIVGLDRAKWLGTDAMSLVPAVVGADWSARPVCRYEDAYSLALEAMLGLRFEAERRGVRLACRPCRNRFLLSPFEARDFIDRVNSPWVGACLNLADMTIVGYAQDWIRTMGHRIVRVEFSDFRLGSTDSEGRCALGEGDVAWAEVIAALKEVKYSGAATYAGTGESAEAMAQMKRVMEIVA